MPIWRTVAAAAACVTMLTLAGCAKDPGMTSGSLDQKGAPPAGTSATTPPPAPASAVGNGQAGSTASVNLGPLKAGDTADFSALTYTLKETVVEKTGKNLTPGEVYLYAHFTVKNGTKVQVLVTSMTGFRLVDPTGANSYRKALAADRVKGPPLDGYVKPGETLDGWVGFVVKPAAGDWALEVLPFTGGKATYKIQVPA